MSAVDDLAAWLARLEACHPKAIDLGLERVGAVKARLGLEPGFPILTVGGTNGKGSVCAYLEAMLVAAGQRVGVYTSPHLLRYNERVRIAGREASDAELIAAFQAVEAARGDVSLTYFEHGTLAAMWLFMRHGVDVAVLEVGLGGRLDAVNLWDADCAIVVTVDLDHQEYLGPDRESIGREKAGIFRPGRPAICADRDPPACLLAHAAAIGASVWCLDRDFHVAAGEATWRCRLPEAEYAGLPWPGMPGAHQLDNAAAAIAALHRLRERLPVPAAAIAAGLASARQPGRFQILGRQPLKLVDVAHNPHAARALAESLKAARGEGRVHAVCAMLADKDIPGVVAAMRGVVDRWHIAGLDGPRGAPVTALSAALAACQAEHRAYPDVESAWVGACEAAGPADTIAAFGSFHTIARIMAFTTAGAHGRSDT